MTTQTKYKIGDLVIQYNTGLIGIIISCPEKYLSIFNEQVEVLVYLVGKRPFYASEGLLFFHKTRIELL